jgi:uncharacterized membrane protein YqjE
VTTEADSAAEDTKLSGSARILGETLLALVRARLELVALEFREEKQRHTRWLVLVVLAALFFSLGLLLTVVFLIVLFWDTHRLLSIALATLLCGGAGGWACLQICADERNRPKPFAATLSEFERDIEALRGKN